MFTGITYVLAAPPTPFAAGNLVVLRYGDGAAAPATGTQVALFLDEYTKTGVLVQSIPLPTATVGIDTDNDTNIDYYQRAITGTYDNVNSSSIYFGTLIRSVDGAYLTLLGYETALNATSTANVPRVIGRIAASGDINTSTAFPNKSMNTPYGVATADGTKFWVAGGRNSSRKGVMLYNFALNGNSSAANSETTFDNGVDIGGANTSIFPHIFNNRLYYSNGNAIRAFSSTTLPTESTTLTDLPFSGFATNNTQYLFFDTDNDGNPDVIYLVSTASKVMKFSFVDDDSDVATPNKWVNKGEIEVSGKTENMKFLTAELTSGVVTIYCTTSGNLPNTPSALYKITNTITEDLSNTGFNGTPLATAPANTMFRGVAFAPVATTQPVKLTSFTGKPSTEGVQLNWITSSEKNNARFEILRSGDNNNFSVIGTVKGNNNSDQILNYSFIDANPLAGTNYYQLNQIDYDEKSEKSAVIAIDYNGNSTVLSAHFSSNNQLDISISSDKTKNAELYLTDVSGKIIVSEKILLKTGLNSKTLHVKGIVQGVYVLNLVSEKERVSIKLLK